MNYLERKIAELEKYLPELTAQPDFDEFWETTRAKAKAVPMNITCEKIDYPAKYVDVYDVAYSGFDETRIHGWLIVPAFAKKEKYACMVCQRLETT